MSLTNPKDFQTFFGLIPKEKRENIWFFPIRKNKKIPEVPSGTTLKGNCSYRLTFEEARRRLKWGANVGIYALQEGLCFLDLDVKDGKLIASQAILDAIELNPTLTIKTRNGGIQKYFWNNGEYPNQVIFETDIAIGELRTDWYYVVSVGSHVEPDEDCLGEPDGTYRISQEVPISQFQAFGDYFRKNEEKINHTEIKTFTGKTANIEKLEDHIKKLENEKKVRRKYSIPERKFLKEMNKL